MLKVMNKKDKRLSNKIATEFSKIFMTKDYQEQNNDKRELSKVFCLMHNGSMLNTIQILGLKRGFDKRQIELARIASTLHDFYLTKTGDTKDHAIKSGNLAAKFLSKNKDLTRNEKKLIIHAISEHSKKGEDTKNWLVELTKDADVLDCYLHSKSFYENNSPHMVRVKKVMKELNIKKF